MSLRAAILFDLDGTLVDTERDNVESVVLALRHWHIDLDGAERHFVVGHSWNEIYAKLLRDHRLQVGMAEVIARAVEEKRRLLAHKGYQPLPGVRDAIKRLGRRAELAVVSGASRVEVHEAVAGLGMLGDFRVLLGAEDYSKGKPDPEPYLTAMRLLGVPPTACIVVEDAEPGILAGRAAGAHVIAVRAANYLGYDQSAADVVLDTLDEMTDELCDRLLAQTGSMAIG
jgi:HAD superfamily hydrolase (TIGR01509 family)